MTPREGFAVVTPGGDFIGIYKERDTAEKATRVGLGQYSDLRIVHMIEVAAAESLSEMVAIYRHRCAVAVAENDRLATELRTLRSRK